MVREATGKPCTAANLRRFIDAYPTLKEIELETKEAILDIAESNYINAIIAGELQASQFYLKTQGKHRGYVERQERTGKSGGPIEKREVHELGPDDIERMSGVLEILARAGALDVIGGPKEPGPPPGTTTH